MATGAAGKATSAVTGGVQSLTGASKDDDSGLGWLYWLLALGLLLFAAWWFFGRGPSDDAASTSATTTEAAAMGSDAAGAAPLRPSPTVLLG